MASVLGGKDCPWGGEQLRLARHIADDFFALGGGSCCVEVGREVGWACPLNFFRDGVVFRDLRTLAA